MPKLWERSPSKRRAKGLEERKVLGVTKVAGDTKMVLIEKVKHALGHNTASQASKPGKDAEAPMGVRGGDMKSSAW